MAVNIHISTVWQALFVAIFLLLPTKVYGAAVRCFLRIKLAGKDTESPFRTQVNAVRDGKGANNLPLSRREQEKEELRKIRLYKNFYFKLQNLEQFPEILPDARDLLISLFSKTLVVARNQSEPGILSVEQYTREGLINFLRTDNDNTTREWEQYLARRRAGSPVEMFEDKEEAKWWLKQIAPVKYVDGSWLGHIHKITTPFALDRKSVV